MTNIFKDANSWAERMHRKLLQAYEDSMAPMCYKESCVVSDEQSIVDLQDSCRRVDFARVHEQVDLTAFAEVFYDGDLDFMKRDPVLEYYIGKYKGMLAAVVIHSRIEYIWVCNVSLPYPVHFYVDAVSGFGPMAGIWKDKPHRLVYDLVGEISRLKEKLAEYEQAEMESSCHHKWNGGKCCYCDMPDPALLPGLAQILNSGG